MYTILTLFIICCQAVVVLSNYQACCKCDDYLITSDNPCESLTCDKTAYAFVYDVCETRREYSGGIWHITRSTTDEAQCKQHLIHTQNTPGCQDGQSPTEGTTCYTCCMDDGHDAFFCVEYPNTNHGDLFLPPVTTTTTTTPAPTTTSTTPTTTSTTPTTTSTTPTTTSTTPTTTSTTPTTTSTTPTTTSTTPTTTSTTHTTTTTVATTTTTLAQTTTTPRQRVECCLVGNCTSSNTITCGNDEHYCMNTIISNGTTTTVKKVCATEMECYYDSYVANKNKPECTSAAGNAGNQSYECSYCCDGRTSVCNTDNIPQQQATFQQPQTHGGTVCEVGRDSGFIQTTCNGHTPYCMNTVIRSNDVNIIKKTCESEILCNEDWWRLTRNRKACLQTNSSMLPYSKEGLVCHYCCLSQDGQPCNTETIPSDVRAVIAKSVDGGWSEWDTWAGCSSQCTGIRSRTRVCNNPEPGPLGENCQGLASEQEECVINTNCGINIPAGGSQVLIGR